MADKFTLSGSYATDPLGGPASLNPAIAASIDEPLVIKAKEYTPIALLADAPVSVPFGTLAAAHLVILKVESGAKVIATVTSADGTAQKVPFDYLILKSETVPITALTLTRTAATDTVVRVFLGEKA